MNVLFFYTWQLRPVHHNIVLDKLEKVLRDKNVENVYFISCDGSLKPCHTNRNGLQSICKQCKFSRDTGLNNFRSKKLKRIYLPKHNNKKDLSFSYSNTGEIKQIDYRGAKIGYGAFSSYITYTRNLEPKIDADFKTYFDTILRNQVMVTDFMLNIIDKYQIEKSYFFNGRTSYTRPIYDICLNKNIEFISLELIRKTNSEYRINEFPNCLPHDIDYHHQRMENTWKKSDFSVEEKLKIGSRFFENRRAGILTRDRKVYTSDQKSNVLPENFDVAKKNIVIFNSSEDEFAAIGDIFEKKAFFKTQEEGIKWICKLFLDKNDYHIYLKIHPNLKEIRYDYAVRLLLLGDEFKNLTVVAGDSIVSTYALMNKAEKVVVFGSSTGVEANYWRKPVINLNGSFYYYLDVAYQPTDKEELKNLLFEKNLQPNPKIESIKYGFYMINFKSYTNALKRPIVRQRFLGFNVGLGLPYYKILGSKIIFNLLNSFYLKRTKVSGKSTFSLPTRDITNKE